jgi:hypothetical protein
MAFLFNLKALLIKKANLPVIKNITTFANAVRN